MFTDAKSYILNKILTFKFCGSSIRPWLAFRRPHPLGFSLGSQWEGRKANGRGRKANGRGSATHTHRHTRCLSQTYLAWLDYPTWVVL